jgi:hypothetical protein
MAGSDFGEKNGGKNDFVDHKNFSLSVTPRHPHTQKKWMDQMKDAP